MRKALLLLLIVVPGIAGVAIFAHYSLIDWASLRVAYQAYEEVINGAPDMQTLFIAEAQQNIHRVNLFAEGVWVLLSAILAAIGIHGLCVSSN